MQVVFSFMPTLQHSFKYQYNHLYKLKQKKQLVHDCTYSTCTHSINLILFEMDYTSFSDLEVMKWENKQTNEPLFVGLTLTQTSLLPLARTPSSKLASKESLKKCSEVTMIRGKFVKMLSIFQVHKQQLPFSAYQFLSFMFVCII